MTSYICTCTTSKSTCSFKEVFFYIVTRYSYLNSDLNTGQ